MAGTTNVAHEGASAQNRDVKNDVLAAPPGDVPAMKTTLLLRPFTLATWAVGLTICGILHHSSGATVAWTNSAGGLWSTPANWDSGVLPGTSDDVLIAAAGTYTVTQDVHVSVARLTLGGPGMVGTQTLTNGGAALTLNAAGAVEASGVLGFGNGTLAGIGRVIIRGRAVWGAGLWQGAVTVAAGGTLALAGNAERTLAGVVTNAGSIVWTGAGALVMNASQIHNLPGALIDLQDNPQIAYYSGNAAVYNFGTFRKSAGGGNSVIGVILVNAGTLEAQSGLLAYVNGSVFNSGTAFTGAGTNYLYHGVVTMNGLIRSENLEIASGVTVAGAASWQGVVRWTGGVIGGAMTIASDGTLAVVGTADRILSGALYNLGQLTWVESNNLLLANGRITNAPGGRLEIRNNQTLAFYTGAPTLNNQGLLQKSAGGGVTILGVPVINSGTLNVESGLVGYVDGSQFNGGTRFTGAGTNLLYHGTVRLNGAIASDNLEIVSGVAVAGTNTLSGIARWLGGTISGAMTVAGDGTLLVAGTADRMLSGALRNNGHVTWIGANNVLMANGRFTNAPGGRFEIQNNQVLAFYNGAPNLDNQGLLQKSAGSGVTVLGVPVINSGTLDVASGLVGYVDGSHFSTGTRFTGAGTNLLYNGTVWLDGVIVSDNLEIVSGVAIAGTHTLSGAARWLGGTISGSMTIASDGTLVAGGTADRMLTGALNNLGQFTWTGANNILLANGRITNWPGGLFELRNSQYLAFYSGQPAIRNDGTLCKKNDDGTTIVQVPLFNSGRLEVRTGTIAYASGSQFTTGTIFTGAGTNLVASGAIVAQGDLVSENLFLGGAIVTGQSIFHGNVVWTAGELADHASLTVASDAVLALEGTASKAVTGSLTNLGQITWSGPHNLEGHLSGIIVNGPAALFEIRNSQAMTIYNGLPTFHNHGTVRKTSGGISVLALPVHNQGTLEVQSGWLGCGAGSRFVTGTVFAGAGTNYVSGGDVLFDGAIVSQNLEFAGATILGTNSLAGTVWWTAGAIGEKARVNLPVDGTLHMPGTADRYLFGQLINAGQIRWSGANVLYFVHLGTVSNLAGGTFEASNDGALTFYSGVSAFYNAGRFRKSGGAPSGNTTINLSSFENAGTIEVERGTLVVGAYHQTGGTLSFGLNSATNHGRLSFASPAALTGTLAVHLNDGYVPVAGNSFTLINYPSRTGVFGGFQLPDTHAWQTNSSLYGPAAVTLTVLNTRPTFDPLADWSIDEERPLQFEVRSADPDAGQSISYSLVEGPDGASIRPDLGLFLWVPTESQGPSTNSVTVRVTDNGAPPLDATNRFTVIVREVNLAPALAAVSDQWLVSGDTLVLTNNATDPDLPANALSYSIVSGPEGLEIAPASGRLVWTPQPGQIPATNTVLVRVNDNGVPSAYDEAAFTVVTMNRPVLTISRTGHQQIILQWPTVASRAGFRLISAPDLFPSTIWTVVTNAPVTVDGTDVVTRILALPVEFQQLRRP